MAAEHLSQNQLDGYGAKTLNSEELLTVDRHLASCDACHDRLTRMSANVFDRSHELAIEEPFHLDYDQHIAPYVDGTVNEIDREIVESHVALCASCAEDLRDLQQFSRETVPASPRPVRRKVALWRAQLWNPQLAAAIVIAIFLVGIIAAVVLWTSNRATQHQAGPAPSPGVDNQNASNGPRPPPDQATTQPSPEKPPSQPLIALNDGGQRITLDERGQSTGLESLSPDIRATVESVLTARRFNKSPAVGNLSESTGRLRGRTEEEDTIVPLSPAGVVIEGDRPTLRWSPLEGASDYVVTIHDSNFRPIESSGPLTGAEWTVERSLPRGVTYSWQIRAVKNGQTVIAPKPPAPEARFRVLDQKAFAAIENARRAQGNSHLAMGVLYWKHGLLDAAQREIEALARANPDSTVAAELLRSLKSVRSQ